MRFLSRKSEQNINKNKKSELAHGLTVSIFKTEGGFPTMEILAIQLPFESFCTYVSLCIWVFEHRHVCNCGQRSSVVSFLLVIITSFLYLYVDKIKN